MEWSDPGIEGSWRFLNKLWKFVHNLEVINVKNVLPSKLSNHNKEIINRFEYCNTRNNKINRKLYF